MKGLPLVALLALLPRPVTAETPPAAQVTIPLTEYENLKRAQERPSLTVVDTLRFSGTFKARDLAVSLEGHASNRMPSEPVLGGAEGVVVYGCEGEGIVSRGERGVFALTPLAPRFHIRCRIASKGSDRLELTSTAAVLFVESAVADGEFVAGPAVDGGRSFSIVRRTEAVAEGLPATAAGRYRITLRPDETRFRYQIEVHNPNRSRQRFDVTLASGEHVQQVDAQAAYDVEGLRYRFELPPGDSTLALSGVLPGGTFAPPIEASLQYMLLESHPLLRPVVSGEVKRVSPAEVGLPAEFRGAQAFLLGGKERLAWSVTRLEALRTTSFALTSAQHTFFFPADGPVLGESVLAIDNQGAPDVSVPMRAEPTYASLQGETVLLTKDAAGSLWLPLSQGQQSLLVQHRQGFRRALGVALASLALPQVPVPATGTSVELRYPADWVPLYQSFLGEARAWTPGAGMILGWVLLALWTERVGAALALGTRPRLLLATAAATAAVADGTALTLLILANMAVSALWSVAWMRGRQWKAVAAVVVALGLVFLVFLVAIPSLLRSRVSVPSADYEAAPRAPATVAEDKALPRKAEVAAYQGLPAKVRLPMGVERTVFSREMLGTGPARAARVLMVSRGLVTTFQILLVVIAVVLAFRARAEIARGFRTCLSAARGEGAVEAAGG